MIHQYKLGGYNIVLDVFSGSVHAVDDVAYDAIALIDEGKTRAEAAAAQETLKDTAQVVFRLFRAAKEPNHAGET